MRLEREVNVAIIDKVEREKAMVYAQSFLKGKKRCAAWDWSRGSWMARRAGGRQPTYRQQMCLL